MIRLVTNTSGSADNGLMYTHIGTSVNCPYAIGGGITRTITISHNLNKFAKEIHFWAQQDNGKWLYQYTFDTWFQDYLSDPWRGWKAQINLNSVVITHYNMEGIGDYTTFNVKVYLYD